MLEYLEHRKAQALELTAIGHKINQILMTIWQGSGKILRKEVLMAYTPELSYENSCVLRRIAWSIGKPMGFALNWLITEAIKHVDAKKICRACKKPMNCSTCPFHKEGFKGRQ